MKSTGNDIVALGSIDNQRTGQFRFYSKILSTSEQALYHQPQFAEMPFKNYVWLLWSVKESAYKYLKRNLPGLVFSPAKIIIQHIEIPIGGLGKLESIQWDGSGDSRAFYRGKVVYESYSLYFRSKINGEWIATVVNDTESFENVYWGIQSIVATGYDHQSKEARTLLLSRLHSFFPGNLQVGKSPLGYPVIIKDTEDMHIPVSLAHDDHFVAYSFILDPVDSN